MVDSESMEMILDLQKLEVPTDTDDPLAESCTSDWDTCCNC